MYLIINIYFYKYFVFIYFIYFNDIKYVEIIHDKISNNSIVTQYNNKNLTYSEIIIFIKMKRIKLKLFLYLFLYIAFLDLIKKKIMTQKAINIIKIKFPFEISY